MIYKKTKIINILLIFSTIFIGSCFADEKNPIYINQAHNNGLNNCDDLINENFKLFNGLEGNKYQLYHDAISSLTDGIKSIRYYFSYGTLEEVSFGDITVIQTPTECQSFSQVSMKFDKQTCSVVAIHKKGGWVLDEQQDLVKWYKNKNNNYSSLMPINEYKGCLFKYYKTSTKKY